MARVLFTVPPLTGHLNPALAVAHVLTQLGHTVAWAVHVGQIGEKLPSDAKVYPLDADAGQNLSACAPLVRGLESVRVFFEDYALPMARSVLAPIEYAARDFQPDIMVVDHQMVAGALVARKLDIPWVTLVTTTASVLKMSPMLDAWVAEQYRELQGDYLPAGKMVARPDFSPYRVIVFSVEALLGQVHERVDACYAFVGPAQGKGRRAIDFPWHWLKPQQKKILVSLGTVSRDRDTRFFEVAMEAVDGLDMQAIMVAPESLATKAPNNVLVRDYVPQLELLRHVDGVICHAGHNTVCESLAHGLPLIVAPIRDDQPVIARQVIDAGAGLFMRHGKVTVPTARKAIECLLADSVLAEGARRISSAFRTASGEAGAAEIIAELASGHTRVMAS